MDSYRIYGLNGAGRICYGHYVDCPDDAEAISRARTLLERYPGAEVWFGRRRVAGAADIAQAKPREA